MQQPKESVTPVERLADQLAQWYRDKARPFFAKHSPERLEQLDGDLARADHLRTARINQLPVCFLGNAGVGKSTLLNAIVDVHRTLLPQGGVGPLTAQRTSVSYAPIPYFQVAYLPPRNLNQLVFALETSVRRQAGLPEPEKPSKPAAVLDPDFAEIEADLIEPVEASGSTSEPKIEALKRQARLLVCGNQFAEVDAPYLVGALRMALGPSTSDGPSLNPGDAERIEAISKALEVARSKGSVREERPDTDSGAFFDKLQVHAAGHLAPLIRTIEVGWDSEYLKSGLVLVDLPGVGVANDEYRHVTAEAIRSARAIVLVVDRAGVTDTSAELLRDVGFLTSLLHDSHDPGADLARLIVAVVKLDLSADDSRRQERERLGSARKWLEHFREACSSANALIRGQIRAELQKVTAEGGATTLADRTEVISRVLEKLEVHTVSALEFRKLHANDDDDRPRIEEPEHSYVPSFAQALAELAQKARHDADTRFAEHVNATAQKMETVLTIIRDTHQDQSRVAAEAQTLRSDLEARIAPLREELKVRKAGYRGFLREAIPEKIKAGVATASSDARSDIAKFLRPFREYHWKTLQATVRRGGAFVGAKRVDLPNDLTLLFEDPVAVVWSKEILSSLRKKTRELGNDYVEIQKELLDWAREQGARIRLSVVEGLHEELRSNVKQFADVGKEAIDELKSKVKSELYAKVEAVVRRRCQRFVDEKQDSGIGVKVRILDLFEELGDVVLEAAKPAATKVLTTNYEEVEQEIQGVLRKLPDPLESIVLAVLATKGREDAKERARTVTAAEDLLKTLPRPIGTEVVA